MRAFLAVADRGSFVAAARSLGLSAPAVTRAVAGIEADLDVALFQRTTRAVRLTEAGTLYADRVRRILGEIETAVQLVRGEEAAPRGTLRITAPVQFGQRHVLPIAEELGARHPGLTLRLTLVDRPVHLIEEGFDLAIRIGDLADSGLMAVPLAQVGRVTVAAPAYLARHGTPAAPGDLRGHRIVAFEGIDASNHWRFGAGGTVAVAPWLVINSAAAVIEAVERQGGIARALSYQVADAVAAGRLVRILQDWDPDPVPVNLLAASNRRGDPNIRAMIGAARAYFATRRWD